MRVYSTSDIPLEDLQQFGDELGPEFDMQVDEGQMFYKGGIPPSWVVLFANPDWLIKAFELYAGFYVAEIVKEAGKDTWKNRKKIASTVGDRIRQFALAIEKLRARLKPTTRIEIGLPLPDDNDGTRLELVGSDVGDLAFQVALFVHHLPALMDLIKREKLVRGAVAAGIHLQILTDGSLEVWWQDNASLRKQVQVLPLRALSGDKV